MTQMNLFMKQTHRHRQQTCGCQGERVKKTVTFLKIRFNALPKIAVKVLQYVCVCLFAQSRPTLCDLMDCSPPGSFIQGDSPGKNIREGCHALLFRGSSQTRDQTQVSHIAGRFFTV